MRIQTPKVLANAMGSTESMVKEGEVLPATQVRTECGVLEGRRHMVPGGFLADCYMGIPYAQPPTGERRFKKPEPCVPWDGVRKCKQFGNRSVQTDMFWDKVVISQPQSEDCLYLNVFAPTAQPGKTYPVMFYIHGGGFVMDSASRYPMKQMCKQLISKEMVVVTINYRLGFLGYLCTGDDASKGNYGLWDQLMALEWTKRNIAAFGGDPDRITVSGQSAGAVSADLLSLSPLSRDLFSRKIVMGANSFCHWATTSHDKISQFCEKKARKLGWKPRKQGYASRLEQNEDMVAFLRTVPAHRFGMHMIGCREVFEECRLPLAPVIDGEILPLPLDELREQAPPMESIVGVGQFESLLFIAIGAVRCNGKNLDRTLRAISKISKQMGHGDVVEAARKIYGDSVAARASKEVTATIFATLLSDIISNYACYKYMLHSQTHSLPCYAYSFDHTSQRMFGWLKAVVPFTAGTHASELVYLFDCNFFVSPLPMNKEDRYVAHHTPHFFAHFVKTGSPNGDECAVEWEAVRKDGPLSIFSISTQMRMKNQVFGDRMKRFQEIKATLKERREKEQAAQM